MEDTVCSPNQHRAVYKYTSELGPPLYTVLNRTSECTQQQSCTNLLIKGAHHLLEELGYGVGLGQVGVKANLMEDHNVLHPAAGVAVGCMGSGAMTCM